MNAIRWTLVVLFEISMFTASAQEVEIRDVVIDFQLQIDLPARSSGVLTKTSTRINDHCAVGQVMAQLDDASLLIRRRAALLQLESARMVLRDDIESSYAATSLEEAEAELEDSLSAQESVRGAIAKNQMRRIKLAVERAHLEVARVEKQRRQAEIDEQLRSVDVAVIDQELARLQCVCPIDGIVLKVHRNVGEWVQAGEPVATVASVGVLRLQALVDASVIDPDKLQDSTIEVRWSSHSGEDSLPGRFVSIDTIRLPGNQVRLNAEVINRPTTADSGLANQSSTRWKLMPGMEVTLYLQATDTRSADKTRSTERTR